jgi:hypothetical protein
VKEQAKMYGDKTLQVMAENKETIKVQRRKDIDEFNRA